MLADLVNEYVDVVKKDARMRLCLAEQMWLGLR